MTSSTPVSPFDRVQVVCLLASLAAVAIYVVILAYAGAELEVRLDQERRQRAHFERVAEEREAQLNGALEKIHELKPDDPAG